MQSLLRVVLPGICRVHPLVPRLATFQVRAVSGDYSSPESRRACYSCGALDHITRDCPARRPRDGSPAKAYCMKCRTNEHDYEHCPHNLCFRCNQTGHLSKNCGQPRACYICKSPDHVAASCTMDPGQAAAARAGRPPLTCYRCNEPGHLASECPQGGGGAGSRTRSREREDWSSRPRSRSADARPPWQQRGSSASRSQSGPSRGGRAPGEYKGSWGLKKD
ncbi:hypothetical protein MKEN_01272700 [Mycena kentingensis (nom. inval.)]|nr:hypothetical protein MKEN_01272700 [Mycena kentingensis (nom. inval.)]